MAADPLSPPLPRHDGRVMLLSVSAPPGAAWHARLIETDARVHDFDSPFELARFLARQPDPAPAPAATGGLR